MKENKTIVYILSNQRSGSTLIENILSKSPQMVSVGESFLLGGYIHKTGPGSSWDWNCSCGESLTDCNFWNKVYDKIGVDNPKNIINTKIVYPKGKSKEHTIKSNMESATLINKIYEAVFNITNCDIVVDSSKEAFYGTYLYENSPFNFKIIHLRRDLRAVTLSKDKWRKKYDKKNVGIFKLLLANYRHRLNCRKLLGKVNKEDIFELNYEEFFHNPQRTLNQLSDFVGFVPFDMPEYMELKDDHTIAGTPNRFEKRKIKYDDRWQISAKKRPIFNALGYILNKIG